MLASARTVYFEVSLEAVVSHYKPTELNRMMILSPRSLYQDQGPILGRQVRKCEFFCPWDQRGRR